MDIKTDVLIIGGGPAGIQASRMLKNLNPSVDVVVLRPEQYSMIYCAIPYHNSRHTAKTNRLRAVRPGLLCPAVADVLPGSQCYCFGGHKGVSGKPKIAKTE